MKKSLQVLALLILGTINATFAADYPPNIDYGSEGDFIVKRGGEYGRTTDLTPIGPILVNFPEGPGSSSAVIEELRIEDTAWDLSDLNNPNLVRSLTCDGCFAGQPIFAHATVLRFDREEHGALLWNGHSYFKYDPSGATSNDQLVKVDDYYGYGPNSSPSAYLRMFSPYHTRSYWEYGFDPSGLFSIRDPSILLSDTSQTEYLGPENVAWFGIDLVSWDHLGQTGVTGFTSWHGNLLVVSSDQQGTGMAIYDVAGFKEGQVPELLSVYQPTLTEPDGNQIGLGGYWSEPYGANKMVWAARPRQTLTPARHYSAMYVVDFTDPRNPEMTCEIYFNQDGDQSFDSPDGDASTDPTYVNFQDNYAFMDHFKVDIEACEAAYSDGTISPSEFEDIVYKFNDIENGCDSSQYFRPLGQVGVFGGYDWWETDDVNEQGMCFYAVHDEADTKAPYISGHRPLDGQTNYPVDGFIHIHIPETLRSETVVDAITVTNLNTNAEIAFKHQLSHTGTLSVWPDADLDPNTSYEVNVSGIRDYIGNQMTPYAFTFSTGDVLVVVDDPEPTPDPGPAPSYSGVAYFPESSSQLACEPELENGAVWAVNPDNDSVTIMSRELEASSFELSLGVTREIKMGYEEPTSVTKINDMFAVTYRDDDKVVFFDASGMPLRAIDTGHGTQPIASVTDGTYLYVSLYGSGEVVKIDPASWEIHSRLDVGPYPRAMAYQNQRLLVTRFISSSEFGEVYDIDVRNDMSLQQTIVINKVLVPDDIDQGSGVPNYLGSIVIDQSGEYAHVTAVKANIDRGLQGTGVALDGDNTVRPMIAAIDLQTGTDVNVDPITRSGTTDLDNGADPFAITFLADPNIRIHALRGNNVVVANDFSRNASAQFAVGFAPTAMCATLRTLYVKNYTDRTVSAVDVAEFIFDGSLNPDIQTVSTVTDEALSEEELQGLQIFYNARVPELGPEGYITCASCHTDGGNDGMTWDMTALGEGFRNTISLNGTSGTRFGNLHWSSNFDEVQDFELQIEQLNEGEGLVDGLTFLSGVTPLDLVTTGLDPELDALAAYVAGLGKDSLSRSPYRTYTGELTDSAVRGRGIFVEEGCSDCHSGAAFRDGQSHDVGTLSLSSGTRLGGLPFLEVRTPTLVELWSSAPYFHNGSADTLRDVLETGVHAVDRSETDIDDLIEYLHSIDRDDFIEDGVPFN